MRYGSSFRADIRLEVLVHTDSVVQVELSPDLRTKNDRRIVGSSNSLWCFLLCTKLRFGIDNAMNEAPAGIDDVY